MSVCISRDTLTVEGPDAAKYLQGQLSNDVAGLAVGSLVLELPARADRQARFRRAGAAHRPESFVIDTDAGVAADVEAPSAPLPHPYQGDLTSVKSCVDLDGDGAGAELIGWWGDGSHRIADGAGSAEHGPIAESSADRRRMARCGRTPRAA